MAGGRPTLYQESYPDQARKLCLLNATDEDLADFFDVSVATISNWKNDHPEFLEAIKSGKDQADAHVAERLYNRAMGYSHKEDKIFNNNGEPLIVETVKHYPPDTTAAIFWLKNRQRDKWRDVKDINGTVNVREAGELSDEQLERIAAGGSEGAT